MVKNQPSNAGDPGSVPGFGRSPGEGNGNPPQYSCLENSMDRGAWWATVHEVTESHTLSTQTEHSTVPAKPLLTLGSCPLPIRRSPADMLPHHHDTKLSSVDTDSLFYSHRNLEAAF